MANGVFYQELCQFGDPSHYEEIKFNEWILVHLYLKCKYVQEENPPVLNNILLCNVCKSEKLLWYILVKY